MEVLFGDNVAEIGEYLKINPDHINLVVTGATPLMVAAEKNRNDVVDFLIANGADVNFQSLDKKTALHEATESGHVDVVRSLLSAKADANIQDRYGQTPIMLAAEDNYLDIVKILTPSSNLTLCDQNGKSAINVTQCNIDTIDYLLGCGMNINHIDDYGYSYLDWAISDRNKPLIKLLIERGIDVEKPCAF